MLKRIYIEITNRCNLRCSFCPVTARPPRTMTAGEFDELAADVAKHTKYIYLHLKGEPLIHPELAAILDSAKRHGLMVNLTTNGLLVPEKAQLLLESNALRQTNLSLHGYTPATHGDMENWLTALCRYARRSAGLGRFTVFRFWTLDRDRRVDCHASRMLELLESQFPGSDLAGQRSRRSVTLEKGIFVSFEEQFRWPDISDEPLDGRGLCYGSRTMLGILADGTVVPCCLDGEGVCSLGNAFVSQLSDILASPRYLAMSSGFGNRQVTEPLCQRCEYRLRFD